MRKQPGGYKCEYYIMKHMENIVSVNIVDFWELVIYIYVNILMVFTA